MAEYIQVHRSWLSDLDSMSLIGDEGRNSFKCLLSFNTKKYQNPTSNCILIYFGNFKETSDVLQSILPDFHIDILDRIAKDLNVPLVISGDTKYLRALLNLGSGGHPKSKFLSLKNLSLKMRSVIFDSLFF